MKLLVLQTCALASQLQARYRTKCVSNKHVGMISKYVSGHDVLSLVFTTNNGLMHFVFVIQLLSAMVYTLIFN